MHYQTLSFNIIDSAPKISDHHPITTNIQIDTEQTLDYTYRSIKEITQPKNNHSMIKRFTMENTDMEI